ncbi:MAG: hypothetical protein GY744_01785 [Gammaproteobacteria bacterium]|nr:hypothetical protein [Gammaproteobacteria bacterium]
MRSLFDIKSNQGWISIDGKGASGNEGRNVGWGYGGGGAGSDSNAGSGGGSCGGKNLKTGTSGGGYSWMNEEYISKVFQMRRKAGRSGGGNRHHTSNGYAKYEISDSNSDTPFPDWVKVDGKLNDISVGDDRLLIFQYF